VRIVRIEMMTARKPFTCVGVPLGLLCLLAGQSRPAAQEDSSRLRVNVVLVQLSVAVTDRKGNYISGLRPEDFAVTEDKIPERISSFEEGSESSHRLIGAASPHKDHGPTNTDVPQDAGQSPPPGDPAKEIVSGISGANVFLLFDTSNYMYRQFVFAQDAIADFIRSMDDASKIAFYSYSRNLSRATALTSDRFRVVSGVRSTVAGDDAALYNSLLLTVKDAAPLRGRKAIVVFSNGPDNASSVPPEDVAELAQSTGTIIYIISTRQAETDPVSAAAFERMSKASGGKAYFAKSWHGEKQAFASIREDLGHLYTLSYYPQPNPNHGWRTINVKLIGKDLQRYHIRTRDGYRLLPQAAVSANSQFSRESETNEQ
jgi:Ca-activated chloride channel homolog